MAASQFSATCVRIRIIIFRLKDHEPGAGIRTRDTRQVPKDRDMWRGPSALDERKRKRFFSQSTYGTETG